MDKIKALLQEFLNIASIEGKIGACFNANNIYPWLGDIGDCQHKENNMHLKQPKVYLRSAKVLYEKWINEEFDVCVRGLKFIPDPENKSLIEYLLFLKSEICCKNESRINWVKSLRSFLAFLRISSTPLGDQGYLECLFPKKMQFMSDHAFVKTSKDVERINVTKILRIPDKTALPIDILATSQIMENLVGLILKGRINLQYSAAEALGFLSICLVLASNTLMTQEKILYKLSIEALSKSESNQCFLCVATYFGQQTVPISIHLYEYLLALSQRFHNNFIFNMRNESLLRVLKKAIQASNRTKGLGKITFMTFMLSPPHYAIGYRSLNINKKKL